MAAIIAQDLYVSRTDLARLGRLIETAQVRLDCDLSYLDRLAARLDQASAVPSTQIPADVVTMHTRVRLRLEDQTVVEYTLVYPEDADPAAGRVSVLAPLGAALLGAREGEDIDWETPAGVRTATVEAVLYQPEANGDFHR